MLRDVVGAALIVVTSGFVVSVSAQTERRINICVPDNRVALSNQQAEALQKALQCIARAKQESLADAARHHVLNEAKLNAASWCGAKTFSIPLTTRSHMPYYYIHGPINVVGKPDPIPPGPGPGILPNFEPPSPYYMDPAFVPENVRADVVKEIEEGWRQAYEDCVRQFINAQNLEIESSPIQLDEASSISFCIGAFQSASAGPASCYETAYCASRRVVQLACNCTVGGGEQCATTKLIMARPASLSRSDKASLQLNNIGCGAVAELAKACQESCDPANGDCLSACQAATAQLLALCAPWLAPARGDSAGARQKPITVAKPITRTSSAKPKNNLDRFELGPTFVNPDSSTAGSRTARSGSAAKSGSGKTGTKLTPSSPSDTVTPTTTTTQPVGGVSVQPKYIPR